MSEKPTKWDYTTTAIIAILCACWAVYEYKNDNTKIPFEPFTAFISGVFVLWGYSRWKKTDDENIATTTQNADKIYNIETIQNANFGNKVENSENAVVDTKIDAGRDVHVGTNIETQIINYKDGREIPRFLTNQPLKADYFIGRDEDLKAIEKDYQEHNRLLVLVNGEGGIGKTTLAAQYWYAHQERYKHLAWLYAERGIGTALVSLAPQLGITFTPNDDEATQIERITEGVNNLDMPCLLVFDNANEVLDVKKHYATLRKLGNCHIILTSRINQAIGMTPFKVKPLDKPDALRLFSHHYPSFDSQEADILQGICVAVGYNTLVLELLAKNLTVANAIRKHYTLSDLLADLQKKGLLAIKARQVDATVGNTNYVETPVDSIISAMYDLSVLSHEERYLLSNFAVLPAENIAIDILTDLLKPDDLEVFDTTLSSLNKKGWIEFQEKDSSFKISPVIQEITRAKNAQRLLADCNKLINTLNNKLDRDTIHENNYQEASLAAYYGDYVLDALDSPSYNLDVLCDGMGYFYQQVGNLSKALSIYEKERTIVEQLIELNGNSADSTNSLATTLSWLGSIHTSLGNLDKALTFFELYIELSKELYSSYPNNVDFKNGLAVSYSKLGDTHSSLGNLNKVLTLFEESNRLERELYSSFPNNVDFKNNLAISYQYLGNTHSRLGNLDKALTFFEEYSRLEKELHSSFPNNVDFKNSLAISYSKLGETHSRLGNLDKALTFFEEYNRLEKELHSSFPNNPDFKNGLAISYSQLGDTHSSLGNLDKALTFFEERNKLSKELHSSFPNNVDFKNGLAVSYQYLGNTHSRLGNLDKALTFFEEYNRLEKELHSSFPNNVDFKNGLAISYQYLGNTHGSLGNLDKALTFFEEYNSLKAELYSSFPNNVDFKNGLAISYCKLAEISVEKKDNKKAKTYYQEAEKLWLELVRDAPQYVQFQKFLSNVQDVLKSLEE